MTTEIEKMDRYHKESMDLTKKTIIKILEEDLIQNDIFYQEIEHKIFEEGLISREDYRRISKASMTELDINWDIS